MSTATEERPALYVVVDRRADGRKRVLATFTEPLHARTYADALRLAGDPVEVELVAREEAA